MDGDDLRLGGPDRPEVVRLLGAIVSASADALVVVDAEGSIVLSSAAVTDLFGYLPEQLVGEPVELLVPSALRGEHVTHRKRFAESARGRQMGSGLQLYGIARDGTEVPIDVSLSSADVGGKRYVAAFVRDARERARNVRQLEAVIEVTRQVLADAPLEETVGLTLRHARELVGATSAWLVTRHQGALSVAAVSGVGEALVGTVLSATASRAAQTLASGVLDVVDDMSLATNVPGRASELDLGPGVYVPLANGADPFGVLVVARRRGEPSFDQIELDVVRAFAAAAAVALTLGRSRQDLERLRIVEEDERIARDLHDTIVQRAFAVGMSLEAVRNHAPGPIAERIGAAVLGLDEMIRDLRGAIFRLSHPLEAGTLRARVRDLAEEVAGHLDFEARVAFRGPVDDRIEGEIASELLVVCREALSNAARHGHASRVDVAVLVEDGSAVLAVTDDGLGLGSAPKAGSGLVNMAERAERLGGSFDIARGDPAGTVLTWRVPLPP